MQYFTRGERRGRPSALIRAALWSGSVASIATIGVLAYWGRRERGAPLAPVNAPSHWIWRDEALHARRFTLRYTVAGYLIHHGSSVFWATFFEHLLLDRPHAALRSAALAQATAGIAAVVDLKLTPRRLRPGFEQQLSPKALVCMYATFGLAMYGAHVLRRHIDDRTPK